MSHVTEFVPLAVGIIISPLPIVAMVAILLSDRGRANGAAFAAGAVAVATVVTAVAALTTRGVGAVHPQAHSFVALILTAVLTIGFAVLALVSWRSRPAQGEDPTPPGWLNSITALTPLRSAGLGILMGLTNAKNLPVELKAGALLGADDLPWLGVLWASLVFAICASLGIIVPFLLTLTGSRAVSVGLERVKAALFAHNAMIMTVLFSLLAALELSHLTRMLLQ